MNYKEELRQLCLYILAIEDDLNRPCPSLREEIEYETAQKFSFPARDVLFRMKLSSE